MSRIAHQGMPPMTKRSFMRSPRKPAADKGDVDQIFFVVFCHGVEDEVDAEVKGISSLLLSAGSARIDPIAQLISLPSAAEIVLAVDHRRRISQVDSLDVGMDHAAAADFSEEIVASERRMAGGEPGKLLIREDFFYLLPEALVEAVTWLTQGVVG